MANKEHLSLIKKDVEAWNLWLIDNPETLPNFFGVDLSEADLGWVDLRKADLSEADLRRADLSEADLRRANLSGANLSGANLYRANLREVNLSGAILSRANFSSVQFGRTSIGDVDLSQVTGLEKIRHLEPSTIGMNTIYKSNGKIPEHFLRGCGLSDVQIATVKLQIRGLRNEEITDLLYYIHRLIVLGAIHSHSSFISYSMNDQEFADRIYDDLQKNGVRCWFATEDLPIGGKLRDEIDRAISRQDNVVLILSEHAVNSDWVEDEVERAFEVEEEREQRILLPIRLDDAVLESGKGWTRKVCRRLVGDFRNWRDERAYRAEFDKLLRGIKATAEEGN